MARPCAAVLLASWILTSVAISIPYRRLRRGANTSPAFRHSAGDEMYETIVGSIMVVLFFGVLSLLEVGRRIGERRLAKDPEGARASTGVVEGAVLALIGLLIAFTFSGSGSRFDAGRDLIVQETNAIGTAYHRLDLLPEGLQPDMRGLFRNYVDARLEVYQSLPGADAAIAALSESSRIQGEIWNQTVAAAWREGIAPDAVKLLLPALNEMIDKSTAGAMAIGQHPPVAVWLMLIALIVVGSLFAGYGMAGGKSRNRWQTIGFAAVISMAVYIVVDLEYPHLGLIRGDAVGQALVELRADMR
jgi:hypothetical protein